MGDDMVNNKDEHVPVTPERDVLDDFTGKEELLQPDVVQGNDAHTRHVVEKVDFPVVQEALSVEPFGIDIFRGVKMRVSGELGQTSVRVRDLISLKEGSMLKLDSLADENITLLINEAPFAHGEVVVINDRYGVRITSFFDEESEDE